VKAGPFAVSGKRDAIIEYALVSRTIPLGDDQGEGKRK
jgi:hypothetical protein